jgi:hypothetical protein
MSALGDKLNDIFDAITQANQVIEDAIALDNGGQSLILLVGEIMMMVVSGGTDVPKAIEALGNLNKIIANVKKAKLAQVAQTNG